MVFVMVIPPVIVVSIPPWTRATYLVVVNAVGTGSERPVGSQF